MNDFLTTADLFAGIGGIRKGFEKEGFQTVYAADSDANCKITYDLNFPDTPLHIADVRDLGAEPAQIPKFDVLLAGFPCQPFSVAGQREGFKDAVRGNLFFDILKVVDHHQPKVVFLENVKHLKNHDNGKTYPIIKGSLQERGYHVTEMIFNSSQYGAVPQNRERIYIVAFKSKRAFDNFIPPAPRPTRKHVIDLLDEEVGDNYYHHEGWLYDRVKSANMDPGAVYQWRRVYLREFKQKGICHTLTANMGMGGHNVPLIRDAKGIRKLTPRECCRLQGFPESYKLPSRELLAEGQQYKQIGNSVTVTVIARIANQIKKAIESTEKQAKITLPKRPRKTGEMATAR